MRQVYNDTYLEHYRVHTYLHGHFILILLAKIVLYLKLKIMDTNGG